MFWKSYPKHLSEKWILNDNTCKIICKYTKVLIWYSLQQFVWFRVFNFHCLSILTLLVLIVLLYFVLPQWHEWLCLGRVHCPLMSSGVHHWYSMSAMFLETPWNKTVLVLRLQLYSKKMLKVWKDPYMF